MSNLDADRKTVKIHMDNEKAKASLDGAVAKAKSILCDIRGNFKPSEGTAGVKMIQSMFTNLWASGTNGKVALIACPLIVFSLLMIVCCGISKSAAESKAEATMEEVAASRADAAAAARMIEATAASDLAAKEAAALAAAARAKVEAQSKEVEVTAKVQEEASPEPAPEAQEEIAITDEDSAQKALRAAYAAGDMAAVKKAQKALDEFQAQKEKEEDELRAKEEAARLAEEKAEEERAAKAEAERMAAIKAKKDAEKAAYEAIPKDLVVKGLYVRMSGDEAAEACKQLAAQFDDLEAIDYRKGIEREKDDAQKAADAKRWNELVALATQDVEKFPRWTSGRFLYNPSMTSHTGPGMMCRGEWPDPDRGALFHEGEFIAHLSANKENSNVLVPNRRDLDSAKVALAAVYGYQVEWMLPGRRAIQEQPAPVVQKAKIETKSKSKRNDATPRGRTGRTAQVAEEVTVAPNAPAPKLAPIEILKPVDLGDTPFKSIFKRSKDSSGTYFSSALYDKGLKVHRNFEGHVFVRLLPKDEAGNEIPKEDLALEIAANFDYFFEKGSSREQKVKVASDYVEAMCSWMDGWYSSRISNYCVAIPDATKSKVTNKSVANCLEQLVWLDQWGRNKHSGGSLPEYFTVLSTLVRQCKACVEWAVLAEPVADFEQITEAFSFAGKTPDEAWKQVCQLRTNLEPERGPERKRLFFKKDLEDIGSLVWLRLVPKTTNGVEVAKEELVNNWLAARGHAKPGDKIKIAPKKLIKLAIKQKGVSDDKLKGVCFIHLDDEDKVKEVYYNENGMNRLFDASDLSGEEFAKLLVKNYPGLPSLRQEVEKKDPGRGIIQESTWTYKCPKGYQLKLFERSYFNNDGVKYTEKMIENDPEVAVGLSLAGLLPDKYLSITATKPDAERKFD